MADPMNALTESVGIRLDRTEKAVAQNTNAIGTLTKRIDNLTTATERLERAVDKLVIGISEQKDSINAMVAQQSKFLELATRQAEIIGQLAGGKAA